jgi:hypothetical protein
MILYILIERQEMSSSKSVLALQNALVGCGSNQQMMNKAIDRAKKFLKKERLTLRAHSIEFQYRLV